MRTVSFLTYSLPAKALLIVVFCLLKWLSGSWVLHSLCWFTSTLFICILSPQGLSRDSPCATKQHAFSHLHTHLYHVTYFPPSQMPQNHPFTISHSLGASTTDSVLWYILAVTERLSPLAKHRVTDQSFRVWCLQRVRAAVGMSIGPGTCPCRAWADSLRYWGTLHELLVSFVIPGHELGSYKNVLRVMLESLPVTVLELSRAQTLGCRLCSVSFFTPYCPSELGGAL